jgi:hypothetical protein
LQDVGHRDEIPTAKKLVHEMREAVRYKGSGQSVYKILKDAGFK